MGATKRRLVYKEGRPVAVTAVKRKRGTLQEALNYVLASWFPVNGSSLREFQSMLGNGDFDTDRNALISHLMRDFSLFGVYLQNLKERKVPHQV
jgi:hypothetical protein